MLRRPQASAATARFRRCYGPVALVTGAAQGLGRAFADALARRGLDLLLVDRQGARLAATCAELSNAHGVAAHALALELGDAEAVTRLAGVIEAHDVGLLVSCAAAIPIGPFLDQPLASKLEALAVNCRAPLALCHGVGERLRQRGRGGLILVSSLSARQGTPLVATYAATKAFNAILAEGLASELGPRGVDVLAVLPGLTDTEGFRQSAANPSAPALRTLLGAEQVAEEALAALGRDTCCVPGRANRLADTLMRRLPRRVVAALLARSMDALYPRRRR